MQQPHHTWPTASNLYNLYQERETFSDPAATGYGSEGHILDPQ